MLLSFSFNSVRLLLSQTTYSRNRLANVRMLQLPFGSSEIFEFCLRDDTAERSKARFVGELRQRRLG